MAELIEEIPDDDYERIQAHCAKGEDYLGLERFAEAIMAGSHPTSSGLQRALDLG
ncbi:MAG: hypothetical protein JSR86_04780 [Proteobacteria bacterium]|nr:hypothetical protein [Pseudomonadota bacterium]